MNELARHIESLLLDNDCVVVPQFGGFVTQHVAAERIEDEGLFLPPMRTVRFNPDLQANDGLLVGSLMKTYRITESEAKRKLHALVLELRQTLLENTSCDFGSMGVFTQNEDGEVSFAPCQAGTVCPALYGLDALHFPKLQAPSLPEETKEPTEQKQPFIKKDEHHITIRINRRLVNYLTAAVAAIVLFFLFSTPARNTDAEAPAVAAEAASFFVPQLLLGEEPVRPSAVQAEAAESRETEAVAPVSESALTQVLPSPSAVMTKDEAARAGSYCVVVASSITEKNAQAYVENLTQRGIEGARVFKKGKMVRVIFPGYATESEAYDKVRALRRVGSEFATAWVHELK